MRLCDPDEDSLKLARTSNRGSMEMRCYFDVLKRIQVDQEGVEVSSLHGAIENARCAIAEVRASRTPALRFGEQLYLLVRTNSGKVMWVIPLDDDEQNTP